MAPDKGPQDQGQQQYQPNYPPDQPPQGRYRPPSAGPQPPRRDEKADEKQNEKEQEKQQEKGQGMDEKYRRNPLGFVTFALLLIWLGVALLLQNADVIPNDRQGWAVFAWGAGGLILVEGMIRLAIPRFRRSLMGTFVWGAIGVGVGFGLWFDRWEFIGPIVIIAIGVAILAGRLLPRR
jgi:hypothetical protein